MFTTKSEILKILKTKVTKISRTAIVNFEMMYKIEFTCGIRTNWTPAFNEKLNCKKGKWEEALSYDKHSVGVFKLVRTLVGHIPIGHIPITID